jgi:hypothetical protein
LKEYAPAVDLAISSVGGANVTNAVVEKFKRTFKVDWVMVGFGMTGEFITTTNIRAMGSRCLI